MAEANKEAVVKWEMDDAGNHRLTYGSQEGQWVGYDFPCHIYAKGKHYIGLSQYWLGDFNHNEIEKPILVSVPS